MNKTTLVLGASTNPERYSYKAIHELIHYKHTVIAVGNKSGDVAGVNIQATIPASVAIDTLTLYLGATNQVAYFDAIIACQPKRVIFNPGTENPALQQLLDANIISWIEACTLVMLRTNQY